MRFLHGLACAAFVALLASSAGAQTPSTAGDQPEQLVRDTLRTNGTIVVHADGFPYLEARIAPANAAGDDVYPMAVIAQRALEKHAGVAVYDPDRSATRPVWQFSLGAVSLIARKMWQRRDNGPAPERKPGERVAASTPSLDELPLELRHAIADYMRTHDEVTAPKIAVISFLTTARTFQTPYMMAPNIPPARYVDEQSWVRALNRIRWFIPGTFVLVQPPTNQGEFNGLFRTIDPLVPR